MATNHQQLYRHNRWANRVLLQACAGLTPDQLATSVVGTYGALDRTLAHLASAEAGYVWRFDPESDRFRWDDEEDPVPPIPTLARVLEDSGSKLIELAGSTPDDAFVAYVIDGDQKRWPAWVVLGQAIDHGREHRSHVATILTQLGIEPPGMDVWDYADAGSPD
jgi:uncharacterized damage-inducible protein DinB